MGNFLLETAGGLWQIILVAFKVVSPFLIALTIAFLLNGPVEWIRQKISKDSAASVILGRPRGRGTSILITYFLVLLALILIIYAFVILIIGALPSGNLMDTTEKIYNYFSESIDDILQSLAGILPEEFLLAENDTEATIVNWLQDKFTVERLVQIVMSFAGSIFNLFVGLVASVYLLNDKEYFLCLWQRFLSLVLNQKQHGIVCEILAEINEVLITFIRGAFIDGLIVALLSSIVLSVLEVRFAVIIGLMGGMLNIIPYFGPFFGMVPAVLVAVTTDGLVKAVAVAVGLFIIQQLDSNYIYPKIVGSSIGLHPLFVLMSLSVLGYFGGIVGMLLAVPTAGIIQVFVKRWAFK